MTVYPIDMYDKDGNLERIEFFDEITNEFQFQAIWDDRDAQTYANRQEFREWASHMAKQMGFSISL